MTHENISTRCVRRTGAILTGTLGLYAATSGCSAADRPPAHGEPAVTATTDDELSVAGVERVIPIRFVQFMNCTPGVCTDNLTLESIVRSVAYANETFKAAGIQFWIRGIDRFDTGASGMHDRGAIPANWLAIKNVWKAVYPDMPLNAWPDSTGSGADGGGIYSSQKWSDIVIQYFAPREELTVVIFRNGPGGSQTSAPWEGRGIITTGSAAGTGAWDGEFNFAHELGHTFGLPEGHAIPDPNAKNPDTYATIQIADFWDMIYGQKVDTAPLFFDSKAAATAAVGNGYTLKPIVTQSDPNLSECKSVDFAGNPCLPAPNNTNCPSRLKCEFKIPNSGGGTTTHHRFTGSPDLKGLTFQMGTPHAPPNTYAFGKNVMAYWGAFNMPLRVSGVLSASQVAMVRRQLRYETPVVVSGWPPHPLGKSTLDLTSNRTRLGRMVSSEPKFKLDFDGDGRRDIAVYYPPRTLNGTGSFRVKTSSTGFSQAGELNVSFGRLTDVPIPADYDGDGKTDFAAFRSFGPQGNDITDNNGYWTWCRSSAGQNCSSVQAPFPFGARGEIPIHGVKFDGDSKDDIAIYRPTINGGRWVWQCSTSGIPGPFCGQKDFFGGGSAIALPGDYTTDGKVDLAFYSPAFAHWKVLTSESGYTTTLTHQFPSDYMGDRSDDPGTIGRIARASAMPLRMRGFRLTCFGTVCVPISVQVPSVFFPHTREWNTAWDVFNQNGSARQVCGFGSTDDHPIPGVDWNKDLLSDFVFSRPTGATLSSNIYYKYSTGGLACSGSSSNISNAKFADGRHRIFSVADMTGDGFGELLQVDPEKLIVRYWSSESGYTVASPDYAFDDQFGVVL